MLLTFVAFSKIYISEVWYFISPCTDPVNPIFAVVVRIYKFKFLIKLFFLITTVAIITEKLPFSYFYGNHCQGNKFLHENNAIYQSKLSLKKWSQTYKESSRKVVIKIKIFFPIVMAKNDQQVQIPSKVIFLDF